MNAKPAVKASDAKKGAGVELFKLVWANAADGRKMIAALSKNYDASVKMLIPKLSEKNDDATVQASFALDGMTMAALAPDMEEKASKLCMALVDNFKLAKNDTVRCILLKCMDQICASVPMEHDKFLKCVGKCLTADEPVFTYALNVLRRCTYSLEALLTISKVAEKADDRKKAILYSAILENSFGCGHEDVMNCYNLALSLKDKPELFRMLCAALSARGDLTALDALMDLLAKGSKIDKGQARRAFIDLCIHSNDSCDDYDDCDCDDDDCDCDCDDDDCDCEDDDCECEDDDCECEDWDDWNDGECDHKDNGAEIARIFAELEPLEPALFALMFTQGDTEETFEILWECVTEGDQILRLTALKYLAGGFERMVWTERILQRTMALESDEAKADAVRMLGKRRDVAARPYVLSCMKDASPLVRQAALEASAQFPGGNVGGARLAGVVLA